MSPGWIVVGGEALVDLVPGAGAAPGVLSPMTPLMGGGPFNVAVTLGRLGAPTRFLSRISTDTFGEALVERLRLSDVDVSMVQRGAEPTTLAVVGLAEDGSARYSFHVEGTADRLVADPGPLPDDVRALSLGTVSLLLEPGASAYEAMLRRESAAGRLVSLDPNVRAALVPDAGAYRARFRSWLPDVGLLKLSEEDAGWLAEGADPLAAVREWHGRGPAAVLLTRGAAGLAALTGAGDLVEVPARPVTVVDTIGAGDTVHGAVLAWLAEHDALSVDAVRALDADAWREALSFVADAAAVTCSRAGAEPPFAAELAAR
ncbi:carbohydrate kinase family protein [Streptoalloteichus hindustanus]|uniref:carbohydrate kinase family protein n=1 Tax=Streptoalloteichus hindustanus TaxID=2017 RepID=UPI001F16C6CF|nr:carbohydrate kinase [Streptoalloteichus hindustanus]